VYNLPAITDSKKAEGVQLFQQLKLKLSESWCLRQLVEIKVNGWKTFPEAGNHSFQDSSVCAAGQHLQLIHKPCTFTEICKPE